MTPLHSPQTNDHTLSSISLLSSDSTPTDQPDQPFRCCRADHVAHVEPVNMDGAPDFYQDVLDFHLKFDCLVGNKPVAPDDLARSLRARLINEERLELHHAMAVGDIPGVADAIGDLIYVLLGTAIAYGIDMRPVWSAIQAANMAKVGGGKRADGKVTKPPGWVAPDIAGILATQGWDQTGKSAEMN